MRSSLTRNIFKALVASEPYCTATSTRRSLNSRSRRLISPILQTNLDRSLFGLAPQPHARIQAGSKKSSSSLGEATAVLVDLVRAQRNQTRLPDVRQICLAFNALLSRKQGLAHLSRSEVHLLTEAFKYIQDHARDNAEDGEGVVSNTDLWRALSSLAVSSGKEKFRSDSKALAYMLFSEYRLRQENSKEAAEAPEVSEQRVAESYIAILSSTGGAREAWNILKNSEDMGTQQNWVEAIKGLSNEGAYQDVWKALDDMKSRTGNLTAESHERLTVHFAKNASVDTTKRIYAQPIAERAPPSVDCLVQMAKFCIREKELSWGESILTSLRSIQQDPRVWDHILVWSAAQGANSNGVAAALHLLSKMAAKANASFPTMANFNSLIEYAFSVGDIQSVEMYLKWAKEHGLQPDAKTVLLQLDYEVKIGDLERALSTFDKLFSQDSITDGSDTAVLNRFLTAICFSANSKYDQVSRIIDSMLERNIPLDAETISGLCKVFLEQDAIHDAVGLLRHHADSYSRSDRARISQVLIEFLTNESVPDQRAFNAYELFRKAFPETPVEVRLPIMHSFFNRKRPDLACFVLGHMRQREDPAARPTSDAYGQCFEGIAKCQDIDGLQMVYNMLKLDLEVEPTTRIRNGLVAAYTACGRPLTAVVAHFWKTLLSVEGPTMNSFALALRACEIWVPQGATEARRIIAMMQAWGIEITKEIYDSYIGAIAGQSEFENAIELIEEMENDIGVPPDAFT